MTFSGLLQRPWINDRLIRNTENTHTGQEEAPGSSVFQAPVIDSAGARSAGGLPTCGPRCVEALGAMAQALIPFTPLLRYRVKSLSPTTSVHLHPLTFSQVQAR